MDTSSGPQCSYSLLKHPDSQAILGLISNSALMNQLIGQVFLLIVFRAVQYYHFNHAL